MGTVIAVDFDGTLCESCWPGIGKANWSVIHALVTRQAEGDKLILWTCRTGELLEEAVLWCLNHGLRFDAVNENLPERIEQCGSEPRKVSADEYWDDRAVKITAGEAAEEPVRAARGARPGWARVHALLHGRRA